MNGSHTALVTGATGAIGQAIAERLARMPGWNVILIARDPAKGRRTLAALERGGKNSRLRLEIADLSRRAEIEALSLRIQEPLDVLINNAAIAPPTRRETPEGIELQFATNVLGYLWMIRALEPQLARADSPRVVNVASYWAGDLELDDLEFRRRRYDNDTAYRQSKQCNRMLTLADAERLRPRGVCVNACHPGDVRSTLSLDLGFGGSESAESAAATPVLLATSPELGDKSGGWFEHEREKPCRFADDRRAIDELRERAEAYA